MTKVIIPNLYTPTEGPLIFLAGPIRSAPFWQDDAIKYLASKKEDITIATPRRGVRPEFASYVVQGTDPDYFSRQRAWEWHYLKKASKEGAILFWLPGELEHNCNKVYGAMTRMELGQWMTNYQHDNSIHLAIGSDGNFPEMRDIAYDLSVCASDLNIHSTLEETCDAALASL